MIKTTYILSANSNKATLYSKKNNENSLTEIKYFECPECKLHNTDLVSDRPGRVAQQSSKRTKGLSSSQTPKERLIEMFAKSLSEYLDKARKENQFENLIIASSPKFLGILHSKLSEETTKTIIQNINKDLSEKKGLSILQALS
jgi:protein required for attachment to host cells